MVNFTLFESCANNWGNLMALPLILLVNLCGKIHFISVATSCITVYAFSFFVITLQKVIRARPYRVVLVRIHGGKKKPWRNEPLTWGKKNPEGMNHWIARLCTSQFTVKTVHEWPALVWLVQYLSVKYCTSALCCKLLIVCIHSLHLNLIYQRRLTFICNIEDK